MRRKETAYYKPSILVLVAALNEEKGLKLTLSELRKYVSAKRLLVVDGKSSDQTVKVAKSFDADVISQEGKGKGDAINSALRNVEGDFDYAVLIDADYTYPAKYIPHMIGILEENSQLGMICGNRFNSHFNPERMPDVFYLGNRLLAFTHNFLNGIKMCDPLSGLRVIRWKILKNWKPRSKGFDIEAEMNYYVERQGYNIREIDIEYRPRIGKKKLKAKDGIRIFKRMLLDFDLQHSF